MIADRQVRDDERRQVQQMLGAAGVDLRSLVGHDDPDISSLQESRFQSSASRDALAEALHHVTDHHICRVIIRTLGLHDCEQRHLDSLLNLACRLSPCTLDAYIQLMEINHLRDPDPRDRWRRQAERRLRDCWYACAIAPERVPVRVDDPSFPAASDQQSLLDQGVMTEVAAALGQHARASIFDRVAAIATDRRYGFGRTAYPGLLYRCDKRRAAPVLMPLLEDPDIGIDALDILGKLKHREALPCAEQFLDHPCKQVRKIANKAILRLKDA